MFSLILEKKNEKSCISRKKSYLCTKFEKYDINFKKTKPNQKPLKDCIKD